MFKLFKYYATIFIKCVRNDHKADDIKKFTRIVSFPEVKTKIMNDKQNQLRKDLLPKCPNLMFSEGKRH